jgi:hypothetical protein
MVNMESQVESQEGSGHNAETTESEAGNLTVEKVLRRNPEDEETEIVKRLKDDTFMPPFELWDTPPARKFSKANVAHLQLHKDHVEQVKERVNQLFTDYEAVEVENSKGIQGDVRWVKIVDNTRVRQLRKQRKDIEDRIYELKKEWRQTVKNLENAEHGEFDTLRKF